MGVQIIVMVRCQLSVVSCQFSCPLSAHAFSNPLIANTDPGPGSARVPACPLGKLGLAWIKKVVRRRVEIRS